MRQHIPDVRVLIDVGANKGLVSAELLWLWLPELNINTYTYVPRIQQYFDKNNATNKADGSRANPGGPCGSGAPKPVHRGPFPPRTAGAPLTLHSFEPSLVLHTMALELVQQVVPTERKGLWQWHGVAMSNDEAAAAGTVTFESKWGGAFGLARPVPFTTQSTFAQPNTPITPLPHTQPTSIDPPPPPLNSHNYPTEGSAINKGATFGIAGEINEISVTTLDRFAKEDEDGELLAHGIDVLKIDAEGSDSEVIQGAAGLISEKKVRVLVYESPLKYPLEMVTAGAFTSTPTKKSLHSFSELAAYLDEAGMDCYIPVSGASTAGWVGRPVVWRNGRLAYPLFTRTRKKHPSPRGSDPRSDRDPRQQRGHRASPPNLLSTACWFSTLDNKNNGPRANVLCVARDDPATKSLADEMREMQRKDTSRVVGVV